MHWYTILAGASIGTVNICVPVVEPVKNCPPGAYALPPSDTLNSKGWLPPVEFSRMYVNPRWKYKVGSSVVFKTPADNRTDYIKRLIGLPGDRIQFLDSNLFLNNNEIFKSRISKKDIIYCGNKKIDVFTFEEKLPNNKVHKTVYLKNFGYQNSDVFEVPEDFYFF